VIVHRYGLSVDREGDVNLEHGTSAHTSLMPESRQIALTTAMLILRSDPEFHHPEAMSMAAAAFGWGVLIDRVASRHHSASGAVASD
jgi:hypothetical protein